MKKIIATAAIAFVAFTGSANATTIAEKSGLDVQDWLSGIKFANSISPMYADHMVDIMRKATAKMWPVVSSDSYDGTPQEWMDEASNASASELAEMMVATEIAPELEGENPGHSEVQWIYKAMAEATNPDIAKLYIIGVGQQETVQGVTWSLDTGLYTTTITSEHVEAFLEARGLND